jgi:fatty acid desaturase
VNVEPLRPHKDYSLIGERAAQAMQKGLADAKWYTSPIPKEKMRELLVRRNGPAVRDTLLWFALLLAFGLTGLALWGTGWAIIPFAIYGVLFASVSDSRWHETGHGTAFKTDWMNNGLATLLFMAHVNRSCGAGVTRGITIPSSWARSRDRGDASRLVIGAR